MTIRLQWPVAGVVSQGYGARRPYYAQFGLRCGHEGIDIAARAGTPVLACADGEVYRVEWPGAGNYGNQVRIAHADGYKTIYAHLEMVNVVQGQTVRTGQQIGTVGSTGNSTGPHLHLTLKREGATAAGACEINDIIDPTPYLTKEDSPVTLRATIGRNILGQYVDHDATVAKLRRERPNMVVVMDNVGFAQRLRRELPAITVIHRTWRQDDANVWRSMSPQSFLDLYAPTAPGGIVLQVLNEPGWQPIDALCAWCEDIMALASLRSIRLALPNFGVGNPEPDDVRAGGWDRLVRAFARFRSGNHIFAFHEYWRRDPLNEGDWVGRLGAFRERFRALGLPLPQMALTEFGRDEAGGERHGYRDQGISGEAYGRTNVAAMRGVYLPWGIPTAIFCEGEGGDGNRNGVPDWASFNTEGDSDLDVQIIQYNDEVNAMNMTPLPPVALPAGVTLRDGVLEQLPGRYVNIRSRPEATGTDVGDLNAGDACQFAEAPGYPTHYFVKTATAQGWVDRQGGKVVIRAIAQGEGNGQALSAAQLQQLATAFKTISDVFANAAQAAK